MRLYPSKRAVKRWAIVAAILLAIALIANGFMAWLTEHRLQTRIAAIRAAGDPASITDLAPKPIPDDQNAAFYLEQLKPRLDAFASDHVRFLDRTELGKGYDSAQDRGEPPTPEQIAAIRTILNKYSDIDAGLATATSCDRYASRLDYSLDYSPFIDSMLKFHNSSRTPARFLRWEMEALIAEGNAVQAVDRGIEILRLARLYENEPTLVSYLVAAAVCNTAAEPLYDALAAGPITAEQRAALDQELARHDDPRVFERALKTERAFSNSAMPSQLSKELEHANPASLWFFKMFGWPIKSYWVGVLDFTGSQIPLASMPWFEARKQTGHAGGTSTHGSFGILADLLSPAIQAAFESNARNLAVVRSLRIFNALTHFREQSGHEANGLADLSLRKEATIDPFSGQPLKLKHTDDGWIVYSVMENGVDDGGDFVHLKDYGVAPPRYRATEKHDQSAEESMPSADQ